LEGKLEGDAGTSKIAGKVKIFFSLSVFDRVIVIRWNYMVIIMSKEQNQNEELNQKQDKKTNGEDFHYASGEEAEKFIKECVDAILKIEKKVIKELRKTGEI
jgi:hypothetical protein